MAEHIPDMSSLTLVEGMLITSGPMSNGLGTTSGHMSIVPLQTSGQVSNETDDHI